jgi:hypothetical protein
MAFWHILWPFGIFFPVLVCCTEKNLATLMKTAIRKIKLFLKIDRPRFCNYKTAPSLVKALLLLLAIKTVVGRFI